MKGGSNKALSLGKDDTRRELILGWILGGTVLCSENFTVVLAAATSLYMAEGARANPEGPLEGPGSTAGFKWPWLAWNVLEHP